MKTCKKCKQPKAPSEFYVFCGISMAKCQGCTNEAGRCRHKANVNKALRLRKRGEALVAQGVNYCNGCKQIKTLDEFAIDKNTWSGRRPRCRSCNAPVQRAAHLQRKESLDQAGRSRKAAVRRRGYAKNPEVYRAIARRTQAKRKLRDPEGYRRNQRSSTTRHRARQRGAAVGRVDYERICRRDGMRCHICRKKVLTKKDLHFDHVIPLVAGGAHSEENIAVSHARCNMVKNAKVLTLF